MNSSPTDSSPTRRPRRFLRWLLVPIASVLVLTLLWTYTNRPEPEVLELTQQELILTEKGLQQQGAEVLFTGFLVSHYPDGVLRSRSEVVDGLLDGLSEGWYPDGEIEIREAFVRGVSHGLRQRWHENGQRSVRAEIRNGQLHGLFERWYESGQIAEVIHMAEGKPHGVSKAYFPSGSLQARVEMKDGKPVSQEFWKDGEMPFN